MRLPTADKEDVLFKILEILHERQVPYAVIGGLAVQLYTASPRTTDDIDLAICSLDDVPREALAASGFKFTGLYKYTENWLKTAPHPVPVQFSYRPSMQGAVDRSVGVDVGFPLQLVSLPDLVILKLEAAEEPQRRRSKRTQDVADVIRLVEEHPELDSDEVEARVTAALLRKSP